ncbi:matrixin family metalloprotease [Sulfitobacter sp. F26204]|uniref:matrixin family metalloprotease n=1 Tax=Sulfitobacter sp. F26204 TaxID=2996014 RepID=UPI00225E45B5|nr:matrixin family metalloprotease [Sulfitobacter sp. F26204]MCX7561843.1 matrixin family metalloprotease [Sulfitobacter sp. F26204]
MSDAKWGTGEYATPGGTVYWSFAQTPGTGFGFSSYITDPAYRDAIRDAFQAWENVADIDFVEVAEGAQTDIHLGWDTIDGPFSVVGEASTRGSKTTSTLFSFTEAEIRFDVSENWAADHDVARNEVGLYQVALHEIGHVIGLDHTDNSDTIMYASDISDLPGLTAGDIAGAQAFYGASQNTPEPAPEPEPPAAYSPTIGNDTFMARAGDDVINGLQGIDTLSLTGDQSQYTLMLSAGDLILTDRVAGRDGTDTLVSIERLDFQSGASTLSNGFFDIDAFDGIANLDAADFSQIVELYIAYFNRAPDALGLAFWGNAFADGLSLVDMASLFIDQNETRATYPAGMSNTDFAISVYENVLGRVPDAEGFDFWVDVLNQGTVGRDVFILSVLEGAKAEIPPDASPAFKQQVMADRQYLENKTEIGAYFAVHKGMSDTDDAANAMAVFDGTQDSIQDAIAAIDSHYIDALSVGSGDFLMPLVGVLDDPFTV